MNEHESVERSDRYVVAVIPERLIAPHSGDRYPRSGRIDDVERFMEESSSWQAVGFSARDNAAFAAMSGGAEFGRMYELGGLIADTGEQLGLVHAARIEGELWRDVIEDTEPARDLRERGQLIGYRMAHRAFLELQTLYVMSIGHRLANIAARFLALNRDLRVLLAQRLRNRPTFGPNSRYKHDWLSLHPTVASKLKEVADESRMSAVAALVEPIDTYAASSAWKEFEGRRGIHFHRWRPQTAGVAGVSQVPPVVAPPGGGFRVSLGTPVPYHDADTLNDELDDLVKAALFGTVDAMDKFRAGFRAAIGYERRRERAAKSILKCPNRQQHRRWEGWSSGCSQHVTFATKRDFVEALLLTGWVTVQVSAGAGSQTWPSNNWRSTASGFMPCLCAVAR